MKTALQLIFGVITLGILFSSCSPITITKRHYKKGYYTDFGFRKRAQEAKVSDQKQQAGQVATIGHESQTVSHSTIETIAAPQIAQVNPAEIKTSTVPEKPADQATRKPVSTLHLLKTKMAEVKSVMSEKKEKTKMGNTPAEGGRSLLWVIIVIIIVVWLISFLFGGFGLGNLMNLLLLVALILLILWLLRII